MFSDIPSNDPADAYAKIGEFAYLEVVSTSPVGAFLDVGLDKDVLLPFREQTRYLEAGDWVIVYLFEDNTGRDCASMRTDKHIVPGPGDFQEGDRVGLLIANRTDLGYRAIIEDLHYGVLYANEVFQPLQIGQRLEGYIKLIRPDGKIDLRLHRTGNKDAEEIGERILSEIEAEGGFLPLHDGSSADEIYRRLGISKKKFKMAVGGLLKERRIHLYDDGMSRKD